MAYTKRVATKKALTEGAVELYGGGSEVIMGEADILGTKDKVSVICGNHGDRFETYVSYLLYNSSKSCPSCLKEMGQIARNRDEWQELVDEKHGKGEYTILSIDTPNKSFKVRHEQCGRVYDSFFVTLYYKANRCGPCFSHKVTNQKELDLKLEGKPFRVKFEEYIERDEDNKFYAQCNLYGRKFKLNTDQMRVGKCLCTDCVEVLRREVDVLWDVEDRRKDQIMCYGDNTAKCLTHSEYYKLKPVNGKVSGKCRLCPPIRVVDTETMKTVLEELYGETCDYSNAEYAGKDGKISIRCRIHDITFNTSYHSHRKHGNGCLSCGEEMRGWGRSGFYSTDKPSNLYLIRINEDYCKVGIAKKLNARYKRILKESGYYPEVIKVWEAEASKAYDVEMDCIHRSGIPRKEWNEQPFSGYTELFSTEYENELVKFLDSRLKQ